MNLSMTTEEIKSRYKSMKPTQDRLQILADLNGCEKKTIQAVLDGHEPDKPKPIEEGRKKYTAWTKAEEESLIKMVKIGFTPKEASQKLGRSSQGTIQKADKLGYPFKVRRGPKGKCESGVCAVSKVGEVLPAVGDFILPNLVVKPEKLPEPITPSATVKSLSLSIEFITDQLNQIIQYADKLRQENDRLTRQLARVREAVE